MLDPTRLDELYARYGFQKRNEGSIRVYLHRQGYFHNADIICLEKGSDVTDVLAKYQRSGIACTVKNFSSVEEADAKLFEGFFRGEATKRRLQKEYEEFARKLTRQNSVKYEYLPCPYVTDVDPLVGNSGLIEHVREVLGTAGPQLVVVEAAAGHGKTCTAFELVRVLNEEPGATRVPLFTELSKNRQARVFRYVLLDEIDRNYPALTSQLVTSEIQRGRVLVVIDGFDELLYKKESDISDEAESMLDTIGRLLGGDAKIVLTTRRTAFFLGDQFHQWVEQHADVFRVSVFSITSPSVLDWLGPRRVSLLKSRHVPIERLANPVLLSYLRARPETDFDSIASDCDELVKLYFSSLAHREQERQQLKLSFDDQMEIFRQLARRMVEWNFRAESRDLVREIIRDDCLIVLEKARQSYSPTERPSVEQLADTLAGHAFLDRVGKDDTTIGFINDFVFGTFVADNIISGIPLSQPVEENVAFAVTASGPRSEIRRRALWEKIAPIMPSITPASQLKADLELRGTPMRNITAQTLEDLRFSNCEIGNLYQFSDCVFVRCVFEHVRIYIPGFVRVGFLECRFLACEGYVDSDRPDDAGRWLLQCREEDGDVIALLETAPVAPDLPNDGLEFRRALLRLFWPAGRTTPIFRRAIQTIRVELPSNRYPLIARALRGLERDGFLRSSSDGEYIELNKAKLSEIRGILELS